MDHTPFDRQLPLSAASDRLNSHRDGYKPEQKTKMAFAEGLHGRPSSTPQHGSGTTHMDAVDDESSRSEDGMRCPHLSYNPQLEIKSPSCEKMFSDVEMLRLHIKDVHGYSITASLSNSSQRESYKAIWRELFAGYRGTIPPSSGLSPDDMRKMHNLRVFEGVVRYLWNQLGSRLEIPRERLQRILNDFRTTNSLFLNTEAEGFEWSTHISAGSAALNQHHRPRKAKPHHPTTIPRDQDLQSTDFASESTLPKHERLEQGMDNPTIADLSPSAISSTSCSLDKSNLAKMMESYWELIHHLSDPEYEDDEDAEERTSFDELHVNRTGTQSNRTLNGPSDAAGESGKTGNGAGRNGRSRNASAQTSTNRNSKRGHSRSSSGDKDDEDSGKKRPKQSNLRSKSTDKTTAKFACPYAKHDPEKPYKMASCCYPGFPSVSRVKEHIYRAHGVVIQCPRCFRRFRDQNGLTAHLRDTTRCEQSNAEPDNQAITVEQERKLRSKMKSDDSEEVKWRQVYRILFDLDVASKTPNPYNDQSASAFQQFSRYEKYSRVTLPSLVEDDIKESMLRGEINMDENSRSTVLEIIRKCQENLFATFREAESGQPHQHTDQGQFDDQSNEMDFSLLNPEVWDFSLDGTGLEEDCFTFNHS